MIRCVVFDFDGTLVDSNEIKARGFYEILRPWDREGVVVDEVMKRSPGDRFAVMREIARALAGESGAFAGRRPDDLAAEWADAYTQHCGDEIARCRFIPGAPEILAWLQRRGITRFVNSGTPTGPLVRAVESRSLDGYFAGVYGTPGGKLENLRTIRSEAGVRADEILFVGDGPEDQEAAEKLPCRFVGVTTDGAGRFVSAPERTIRNLTELQALVEES